MLPFGVTIPASVPQRSEIPEGLMNYPVLKGSYFDQESTGTGDNKALTEILIFLHSSSIFWINLFYFKLQFHPYLEYGVKLNCHFILQF
jgi:hypothetical protein